MKYAKNRIKGEMIETAFSRFGDEITNTLYAKAFLTMKNLESQTQKEFCKKLGLSVSRFSRVVARAEEEIK